LKWLPGTGPSARYFVISDCGRWQICKSGEPPIYTLAKLGGKYPELVMSGTQAECKGRANEDRNQD
jgi:hypothetical protein